jgi:hypothetical protein
VIREVQFFKSDAGRSPVEEFLDTLSPKQALKVAWVINLVEDMDVVPTQFFQKMKSTEDLWEIRVKVGNDISGSLDSSMVGNWWCFPMHSRRRPERLPNRQFGSPRNANERTSGETINE